MAPGGSARGLTLAAALDAAGLHQARIVADRATVVTGITQDSRAVGRGDVYCAVRGRHHDGHEFAGEAVTNGAAALLVERELDAPVAQIIVEDARVAMAPLAAAIHGFPARRMTVVGVTGTNGKTTTVSLLASILRAAGHSTEIIGTLTGSYTTPEAPELQARLASFVDAGVSHVAMEVSSHALVQHRVDAVEFAAAVFTNLGHDHLDLHGDVESYFAAKRRLFESGRGKVGIVDVDDEWGRRLAAESQIPIVPFSLDMAGDVEVTASHHRYVWRGSVVSVPLGGAFNVANSLAAATTAATLGIDQTAIVAGLAAAPPVPGRFETIHGPNLGGERGEALAVVVDYAHTPDGLHAVIAAARAVAPSGRVIVVFGCGGDRDREKRPQMGAVVSEEADLVVVTSDNPRCEDPQAIIGQILVGIPRGLLHKVTVEPDRRAAIATAIAAGRAGDVVVVAGKGHEVTQTIGNEVLPFDDRVVVREVLAC